MQTEVTAEVVQESGRWTVYLVVLTDQGIDRRVVSTHASQSLARLAADVINRTAARRRAPAEGLDDTP